MGVSSEIYTWKKKKKVLKKEREREREEETRRNSLNPSCGSQVVG